MKRMMIGLVLFAGLFMLPAAAQAGHNSYGFSFGFSNGGYGGGFAYASGGHGGYYGGGYYGGYHGGGYCGRGYYGGGYYGGGYYGSGYCARPYYGYSYAAPVYVAPTVVVESAPVYYSPRAVERTVVHRERDYDHSERIERRESDTREYRSDGSLYRSQRTETRYYYDR